MPRDSLPFAFTEATPTREFDTIYQNGSKPRLVVISVKCIDSSVYISSVTAYVGATSPPALERALTGYIQQGQGIAPWASFTTIVLVQPFYYYRLINEGAGEELKDWVEYDLG